MDRASQALLQGLPAGVPVSYRTLAEHSGVSRSTLHSRAHGRRSLEAKAESQQYLTPVEETALADFILQMSTLGYPVRIKPLKRPGKNWARAFERRHPELQARRVRALDWNRHDRNIREKVIEWFEVIEKVVQDPAVLAENVYNMDETGVMLSMLGAVKVLIGKDHTREYRGARVKRTTVTAIECISANGRHLKPMIIWPATTHRCNWTTFDTPNWHYACSDSGYIDSKISLE